MKTKLLLIVCICLIATFSLTFVIFAQEPVSRKVLDKSNTDSKELTNEQPKIKKFKESVVKKDISKKRRYKNTKGKRVDLVYKTTQNFGSKVSKNKNDSYDTYDEYTDKEDTVYYFLENTDKLCLKMEEHEYDYLFNNEKTTNKKLSNDKIKNIAEQYILDEIGDDFEKYTFHNVQYQEQKDVYLVEYIRKLGKYITDDSITAFIDNEGNVYAFSAMNRDRYESFTVSDIDQESLEWALQAVKNGEWELENILISMDQSTGHLMAMLPRP